MVEDDDAGATLLIPSPVVVVPAAAAVEADTAAAAAAAAASCRKFPDELDVEISTLMLSGDDIIFANKLNYMLCNFFYNLNSDAIISNGMVAWLLC